MIKIIYSFLTILLWTLYQVSVYVPFALTSTINPVDWEVESQTWLIVLSILGSMAAIFILFHIIFGDYERR